MFRSNGIPWGYVKLLKIGATEIRPASYWVCGAFAAISDYRIPQNRRIVKFPIKGARFGRLRQRTFAGSRQETALIKTDFLRGLPGTADLQETTREPWALRRFLPPPGERERA